MLSEWHCHCHYLALLFRSIHIAWATDNIVKETCRHTDMYGLWDWWMAEYVNQ